MKNEWPKVFRWKQFWKGPMGRITEISFWVLLAFFFFSIFSIGPGSLEPARRAKALNSVSQIEAACQNYKAEYSVLPQTPENYRLTKILCGDNPRKIAFLYLKPTELNANGEMIDPWGTPFRVTFDLDSGVHVFSAGPDKIFGTKDDITNQ